MAYIRYERNEDREGGVMEFTIGNLVKWFQLKYPQIVKAMHDSSHHYKDGEVLNPYHLEGSVFTHNMMVMLEAARLEPKLDRNMSIHTAVAALLHDIGKPLARKNNHEKQRVHFWGHEPMSAFLSLSIIDHIEKDFNVRLNKRLIVEAIAMHTDVYNVSRDELSKRLVNNQALADLLSNLSECDYAGRFFEVGERDMGAIQVENKDLLGDKLLKKVIVMVGLPCSGKSTIVNSMRDKGFAILCRDDIILQLGIEKGIASYNKAFFEVDHKEVDRILEDRKREYIKQERSVVIDMTNMSRKSRRRALNGFKNDYIKIAQVVMADLGTINKRNSERENKFIPEEVFERMITSFQPPLHDEFDEIDWEFN